MPDTAHTKDDVLQLIASLTRAESGKLIAVLTRIFGAHNLSMAEDAVQDVLIKAMQQWEIKGIPADPAAWLFSAARNRAIDIIRQHRRRQTFATDISSLLDSEYTVAITLNDCFKDEEIKDDQLRMMFACSHPAIPREGQIALILKTLCGFTIPQIARAFICPVDTIEKRLYRARQVFRQNNFSLEIPLGHALEERLDNVLETIYLLFNEAHSTSFQNSLVREDLAADSISLCRLLAEHSATNLPRTHALLALLYLHAARLPGRTDVDGNLLLMNEQDRNLWNKEMISYGKVYLNQASVGNSISRYHLEAAIAYEHCKAARYEDTDWKAILSFYDILMQLVPSPVVLLNRAVAVKELQGAAMALECIKQIPGINYLNEYYLLHAILGELYAQMNQIPNARKHYQKALSLIVSTAEKNLIHHKLNML